MSVVPTPERTDDVTALLIETARAHGRYEESELGGIYDEAWARWYATYAVEHGLGELLGQRVTADRVAEFLRETNAEFQMIDPEPVGGWPTYTSRRIVEELRPPADRERSDGPSPTS